MIIPGILEQNWQSIKEKIETVKFFSKTMHIDVIDGNFINNQTFLDPKPFSDYAQDLFFEAHLMVNNPINFLDSFANAGFKRFLGHVEKMDNIVDFVAKGQLLGEVGLAFDLDTDIAKMEIPYDDLDCILLMGVKAGYSGQEFVPKVLEKIKNIREKTNIAIEVDGGVGSRNILDIKNAGANRFVATSYLFHGDPLKNYETLFNIIK